MATGLSLSVLWQKKKGNKHFFFRIYKKDIRGKGGLWLLLCTFDSEWVVFHFEHHLIYKAL